MLWECNKKPKGATTVIHVPRKGVPKAGRKDGTETDHRRQKVSTPTPGTDRAIGCF
jgi:hypothetical protein